MSPPNFYPTAGAPLSGKICEFFIAMGIDIIIGYGLSETTATVSCFPKVGYEIGTVGKPLPGIKVKIDSNGEILVKGPTVTPGYYNNPDANQSAFTEDGYFRTGDAGYLTDNGAIVLTERVKDLFKTSNGKYIAPQMIAAIGRTTAARRHSTCGGGKTRHNPRRRAHRKPRLGKRQGSDGTPHGTEPRGNDDRDGDTLAARRRLHPPRNKPLRRKNRREDPTLTHTI